MSAPRRWSSCIALLAVSASLVLSACGGDSGGGDSGSTAASTTADAAAAPPGVEAATKAIAPLEAAPSPIPVEQPLKTKPTGKHFVYVQCAVPECAFVGQYTKEAAKELGAKVTIIEAGGTAESIGKAFNTALQLKPDVLLENGIDPVLWKSQLAKAKEMKIPVVAQTTPVKANAGDGISWGIDTPATWTHVGTLMADWVVSKSAGKANTVLFWPPQIAVFKFFADGFQAELADKCAECKIDVQTVPGGDIGTPRLPNRVVSYLQAHPETKYVTMAFGSMAIGLPQALAAAGLTDKVTVISEAGGPINFQYIKSGQQTMDLAQDLRVQAWTGVDAAARLATGQKTTLVDPLPPIRFLTKDNITFDPQGGFTAFPDYKEHFRKQWGITT